MFTNEKGITLVELLATLALMSMVILLISSVHIFGQKQFTNQTTEIENQSDVRYAMSQLTNAIRKGHNVSGYDSVLTIDGVEYKLNGTSLMNDNQVLVENIQGFCVNDDECPSSQDDEINISITSVANQQQRATTLSTLIYVRE